MAEQKFISIEETQLPTQLKLDLQQNHFVQWNEMNTAGFYRVVFTAIPLFMRNHASKDAGKIGFKVIDFKGNFIMGAVETYHAPDESAEEEGEESKGSWSLEFTFNESDLSEVNAAQIFDSMNNEFIQVFERQLWEINKGRFCGDELKHIMLNQSLETLYRFMDKNTRDDGSEFSIGLDGYFIATSAIEDGEKIISIVPGSIAKQCIKDDAVL